MDYECLYFPKNSFLGKYYLSTLGAFSDKFCFHKILALVIQICFQVGLHKVDGVDTWAFYVAAYEIAHKIEADYNSADLEEGIA